MPVALAGKLRLPHVDPDSTAKLILAAWSGALFAKVHLGQRSTHSWAGLSTTLRAQFRAAGVSCQAVNADPREYVMAQFSAFEQYTRWKGKRTPILPMPNQLHGLAAQARFIEWKAGRPATTSATPARQVTEHYREQRKLNALCKRYGRQESDVLTTAPGEFTREFLQFKGVWGLPQVRKLFSQQRD